MSPCPDDTRWAVCLWHHLGTMSVGNTNALRLPSPAARPRPLHPAVSPQPRAPEPWPESRSSNSSPLRRLVPRGEPPVP